MNTLGDDGDDDAPEEHIDIETGEVLPAAPRAPRVRSLDQIINRANGGQYRDDMPKLIEQFYAALFAYAQDHDTIAKGELTVKLKTEVDPFGETTTKVTPVVKLPDPPAKEGLVRMFMHADGTLVTHQQHEMALFRNVSKPDQKLRDRAPRED